MNKQELQEAFICRAITKTPKALYNIGVGPKSEYLTLKGVYPDMTVFGCEPLASEYDGLYSRFNGELLEVALGRKAGTSKIYYTPGQELCASMKDTGKKKSKTVDVITLDEFDNLCDSPEDILLWADIEGMELEMLQGGKSLLASGRVLWINLEEHTGQTKQREKIDRLLNGFDFKRTLEYNKHVGHQDVLYVHKSVLGD